MTPVVVLHCRLKANEICYHINKKEKPSDKLPLQTHKLIPSVLICAGTKETALFFPSKDAQIIDSTLSASSFHPLAPLFSPTLSN